MIKAVHASNIPSDLPRSPLQPGLSGDLARDRDAFAAFWSQCDELRLRFPPKPSRTAAEATACAAILAAERRVSGPRRQRWATTCTTTTRASRKQIKRIKQRAKSAKQEARK